MTARFFFSGCYEKSCAVYDRAYSSRKFKVSHYRKLYAFDKGRVQ